MESVQLDSIHARGPIPPDEDVPDERTEPSPNAVKDAEMRAIGFEPTEFPLADPCHRCGYRRRYSAPALANLCLYCDAAIGPTTPSA